MHIIMPAAEGSAPSWDAPHCMRDAVACQTSSPDLPATRWAVGPGDRVEVESVQIYMTLPCMCARLEGLTII
jgi:hypothetical protein